MTYQQGQGGSDYVPGNHNYTERADSGPNKNREVNNKGQTVIQQNMNFHNPKRQALIDKMNNQ